MMVRSMAQRVPVALAALLALGLTGQLLAQEPPGGEEIDRKLEVRRYDVVIMKEGPRREYVGEILEDGGMHIEIRLVSESPGSTTLKLSKLDIAHIYRANPPAAVYKERLRRLRDGDKRRNPELQWQLAQWCLSDEGWGLTGEAVHHLELVTILDPSRAEAYVQLVDLYGRTPDDEKDFARRDREIGVYHRGMKAGITNPDLPYRAAAILERLGDTDTAIHMYERLLAMPAVALGERKKAAENELARLYEQTGQREKAEELVERSLAEDDERSPLELQTMRARWLLEGYAAGDTGAAEELDATLEAIVAENPEHGEAFLIRGCRHLIAEDFEASARDLLKAARTGVAEWPLFATIALNYARVGDTANTSTMLNRIQNVTAAQELVRLIRAYNAENLGEGALAWELIREAVSVEDASWQSWLIYLQALTRYEPDTPLEDAAEFFLEKFGSNPIAFGECALLIGDDAIRKGDGTRARRWLAYAQEVQPRDAELLIRMGHAHLLEGGDLVAARRALEAAYAIDPRSIDLRNGLGCLEYRSGELEVAQRWFEGVVAEFSDEELESPDPPSALAYAQRALRQIDGVLGEELWLDGFDRDDSARVLNNWEDDVRFGVSVKLERGRAVFAGTQEFQDDELTLLYRRVAGDQLSRVRCLVRLGQGADDCTVALRFEDEEGEEGVIFFRDLDGVLCFAVNGRESSEVHRPPDPPAADDGAGVGTGDNDDGDDDDDGDGTEEASPFDLRRIVWAADGADHLLEIRLDPVRQGQLELYFDGERVARKIRVPNRGRGEFRVGLSGMAKLGVSYRFSVDDFEIYRRRPVSTDRQKR